MIEKVKFWRGVPMDGRLACPPQGGGFGIRFGLLVLYLWVLELSHQSGDRQKIAKSQISFVLVLPHDFG